MGRHWELVNLHNPTGPTFRSRVDFTPQTYRDLIERYNQHPERKFTGPDGTPCDSPTVGLLRDLPIVASWIRLIGKEGNEIEQIDVGLIESEDDRMIVYDDGEWDAVQRVLTMVPTKDLQRTKGYSRSMAKYVKSGERRPRVNELSRIASIVATYARECLGSLGYDCSADDWETIAVYGICARHQESHEEQARQAHTAHRERKRDVFAALRAITNNKGIAPTRDSVAEWAAHISSTLRRKSGVLADDVAASLASDYPQFGVVDEASLFDLFDELQDG